MNCSRRVFLTTASGVAVSVRMAGASVQGANDRVRVAIIGTGGAGKHPVFRPRRHQLHLPRQRDKEWRADALPPCARR